MPIYVDPRTGETYDNVPQEDEERARSEFGLIPHEEWQQREADKAVDTKGPVGLIAEGAERGLGHAVDVGNTVADAIMPEGYGTAPGLVDETPRATGASLFPEANSDAGRRRTELHPYLEGGGTGLAAAPFAGLAGAAAGGLGLGVLGAGAAATTASTVVEAAAQEYDDAWLEKRPMELKNVAGLTAMFGIGGVILHQAGKVVGKVLGLGGEEAAGEALGAATPKPSGLGGRNIVAEATAKAEHAAGGNGSAARSVGAASAEEMQEPFDAAIGSMTDRDAVVLARDADDHLRLAARHSADDLTRLAKGLSESLGTQLKHRDIQIAMDALTPKQREAQAAWSREIMDTALGAAQHLRTGGPARIDFGNRGKAIAADIESYARMMQDTLEPAKRFQVLEGLKKRLDSRVMDVGADFHGDQTARQTILEILEPLVGGKELPKGAGITKGALREGLENTAYWGHAGKLHKELNKPWHELLKHWTTIQKAFLEHVETKFGATGANRRVMASDPDLFMSVWEKDPRSAAKIGNSLRGMFDGYQGLIEARDAHGFVDKEGLPALRDSIANMMEDWNLAATVGIARNKVKHASLNPKRFEKLLALAERAPFGVGGAVGAARQVAGLAGDLRIQKGTPLAEVWDRGLKRYALHPELGDVSISANYSPWMQEALRARGAPIPGGTPPAGGGTGSLFGGAVAPGGPSPAAPAASGGGLGQAAAAAAKEHGGKVAGVGLLAGASALDDKDNPNGAAAAGVAGLALLLGKGRRLIPQEARALLGELGERSFGGSKLINDGFSHMHVDLAKALDSAAPLTLERIEQHAKQWVRDPSNALKSVEVEKPIGILREAVSDAIAALPEGATHEAKAAETDRVLREIVGAAIERRPAPAKPSGLFKQGDVSAPVSASAYNRGHDAVSAWADRDTQKAFADYVHDDKFEWINGAVRAGTSKDPARAQTIQRGLLDAADAGLNMPGRTYRVLFLRPDEVARLSKSKVAVAESFLSASASETHAQAFARKVRDAHPTKAPVVLEVHQASGVPVNPGEKEVLLPAGTKFDVSAGPNGRIVLREQVGSAAPVADVGTKAPAWGNATTWVAGGLIAVPSLLHAENAKAAPELTEPPDPGPSPQVGPVGVYRDAMRTVAQGGEALIRQKATAALRMSPPKGRGALHAFMGRRNLDDAVDAARDTLRDLQNDPEALVDRLAGTTGELGTTHPAVYMALVEKAHGLVSYLAAEAPQRTGKTLLDPEGTAPSHDRSLDFAFKTVGALMPVQAMNDVARLDAAPEEVAAFQQNWPELWEPLRAELLGQVQRRTEAGRPVDSEKLRQLDALLQMDGQLDPSASSAVAQQMLSAQEQAAPPAQGGGGSGGAKPSGAASSSFRTRLDSAQMENAIG